MVQAALAAGVSGGRGSLLWAVVGSVLGARAGVRWVGWFE